MDKQRIWLGSGKTVDGLESVRAQDENDFSHNTIAKCSV